MTIIVTIFGKWHNTTCVINHWLEWTKACIHMSLVYLVICEVWFQVVYSSSWTRCLNSPYWLMWHSNIHTNMPCLETTFPVQRAASPAEDHAAQLHYAFGGFAAARSCSPTTYMAIDYLGLQLHLWVYYIGECVVCNCCHLPWLCFSLNWIAI